MLVGSLQAKYILQMINFPRPATDTLPSHSPLVDETYILTKFTLNFPKMGPIPHQTKMFTGWLWGLYRETADGKLSLSSDRHSPKSSMPVTLLKLWTDSDKNKN